MKSAQVAALLLMAVVPLACIAQKKAKKPEVPAALAQAKFVYVEAIDGGEFDRNLYPADRMAIADVRDYIKAWGRYTITVERDKADLIFIVRKGRLASADVNTNVGVQDPRYPSPTGQPSAPGQRGPRQPYGSVGYGGEIGPAEDLLQICLYNAMNGKPGSPLWYRSEANGLDAPRVRLMAQFKDAVEKAYPTPLTTNSQGNGSTKP
jgi:hypothetical protein